MDIKKSNSNKYDKESDKIWGKSAREEEASSGGVYFLAFLSIIFGVISFFAEPLVFSIIGLVLGIFTINKGLGKIAFLINLISLILTITILN
jgi:uncharacterized membrane protein HdeD (DUF308 family)